MANPSNHGATVAFDIEVAGLEWEKLDEATRGYLLERARTEEDRAHVPDRLALFPGCGQIVAIALFNLDEMRGAVLHEGADPRWQPWPGRSDGTWVYQGTEADMLSAFWERMRHYGRLISFCGRTYDGPVLMIRSAMLGIPPSRNLVPPRYQSMQHLDLMEVLTFQGAVREKFSLEYWCRRFDVESPKVTLDGSQVQRAYGEGRITTIADYCLRDARATAELFLKLEKTLVPLF